jgi:hypothetical protein
LGTNEWNALNPPALALLSYTAIIHRKYDFPNNDIALIKLPIEVTFTCEYCHIMTKVKIVLLVLEQIKGFLFKHRIVFVYLIHEIKDLSVV